MFIETLSLKHPTESIKVAVYNILVRGDAMGVKLAASFKPVDGDQLIRVFLGFISSCTWSPGQMEKLLMAVVALIGLNTFTNTLSFAEQLNGVVAVT